MEYKFQLRHDYIWLPIAGKRPKILLEILADGEKQLEFWIPFSPDCQKEEDYDFFAPIRCSGLTGCEITLRGEFTEEFARLVRQYQYAFDESADKGQGPEIHFHPVSGWINDPNGLVCQNGIYHLYYQYNPLDTEWDNMSWGHAVSRDLLHWEEQPAVMYPDEDGMIFSGCGLRNDRGHLGLSEEVLLFFYSAAGGSNPWSRGKEFVQKLAYSLDGGRTLIKSPAWVMNTICKENRDPKIFWHEPTQEYVMVLWLEGNDFGIFTSPDLKEFIQQDRLTLEDAWECPDLLKLKIEDSCQEKWIFWSADGFYYLGEFDGRKFYTDGKRLEAYGTKLPYAAQTYSGVEGRVISVPWLRTQNSGRSYHGVMGLPRELSLRRTEQGLRLVQKPVREWDEQKHLVYREERTSDCSYGKTTAAPFEVFCGLGDAANVQISVLSEKLCFDRSKGMLSGDSAAVKCPGDIKGLSIIVDGEIIEITDDSGIMNVILERKDSRMEGTVSLKCDGLSSLQIYEG